MAVTVNLGRVQPIYRGPYSPSFPYRPLDFVTFDGVTYYCIKPVTGTAPPDTEFWVSILQLPLGIAAGGTGAITAEGARTALGATSVGGAVFTAADAAAARGALGASAVGGGVFTAEDQAAALAALGALASDGSVALSGDLDADGNKVTHLVDGVDPDDAATVGQLLAGRRLRGAPILITSSGTYTPDAEVKAIWVEVLGAGAGGGGENSNDRVASGGGSGAYAAKFIIDPNTETVTIGAAGAGGVSAGGMGQDGGNSSFGSGVVAEGGKGGGSASANGTLGGAGGIATGGDINIVGGQGHSGGPVQFSPFSGAGADAPKGFGQGAPAGLRGSGGLSSIGYGSGGGGGHRSTTTSREGGAGTDGLVVIWEFI